MSESDRQAAGCLSDSDVQCPRVPECDLRLKMVALFLKI